MLILSRKLTERIHIGDSIVVTVLEIRGNKVRIGIDAPREVHVLRSELQDEVSIASGNRFLGEAWGQSLVFVFSDRLNSLHPPVLAPPRQVPTAVEVRCPGRRA
jgi:carbon storage regulator